MQRCMRSITLVSMLLLIGVATASPAVAAKRGTVPGLPVQLSLGDSWAFGFGAAVPSEGGYVGRLHEALQERYDCLPAAAKHPHHGCKQLQLVNLAVGGATTPSLIAGQLPAATTLLEMRNGDRNPRNDVEVVTLHIGGNDVTGPIIAACIGGPTPSCLETIAAELAAYRIDLDTPLSRLRAAAGDETRIVIGTYDNPIPTCDLAAVPSAIQTAALALEGGPGVPQGLHDIMRDVAADYGVEVAEVYGDLGPQDWVGGQDCLHPDDSGYAKVAEAFLEVLVG
jgi:lysophospholipase L1-like esterase